MKPVTNVNAPPESTPAVTAIPFATLSALTAVSSSDLSGMSRLVWFASLGSSDVT